MMIKPFQILILELNYFRVIKVVLIIAIFLPWTLIGQEITADQKIRKAGYLLSVSASRLNVIRTDLEEISKKYKVLNGADDSGIILITLLVENISMVYTICVYEGLLLDTFDKLEEKIKLEQYDFHYSRMKKSTLKKLYLTYTIIQTYTDSIKDKEVLILAIEAKEEIVKVQNRIEDVISILHDQRKSFP